jgi:hypothetical protein
VPMAHTLLSLLHQLLHEMNNWDDHFPTAAEAQPTLSYADWLLATAILLVNFGEGAVLRGEVASLGAAGSALLKVRCLPPSNVLLNPLQRRKLKTLARTLAESRLMAACAMGRRWQWRWCN